MADVGQFVMKLWDEVIAKTKTQMVEAKTNFLREMPRRYGNRTSVTPFMAESYIQDISDQLIKITSDQLNTNAVTTAKKVRQMIRSSSSGTEDHLKTLTEQANNIALENEGLKAKIESIESKITLYEEEKQESLILIGKLNSAVGERDTKLSQIEGEYTAYIHKLNAEWEAKFSKVSADSESYLQLKKLEVAMDQEEKPMEEKRIMGIEEE